MQISVQIGLNWNWPTGTELGKNAKQSWEHVTVFIYEFIFTFLCNLSPIYFRHKGYICLNISLELATAFFGVVIIYSTVQDSGIICFMFGVIE